MKVTNKARTSKIVAIVLVAAGCVAVAAVSLAGGQPRVGHPESVTGAFGVDPGTAVHIVER